MLTKSFRFRLILSSLFSSINPFLIKISRFDEVTIHLSQIKTWPAPWMARAYNPVGRAREARLQNICLTCTRELARNPPRTSSGLRDKRACQVEAVVRSIFFIIISSIYFSILFAIIMFFLFGSHSSSIPTIFISNGLFSLN